MKGDVPLRHPGREREHNRRPWKHLEVLSPSRTAFWFYLSAPPTTRAWGVWAALYEGHQQPLQGMQHSSVLLTWTPHLCSWGMCPLLQVTRGTQDSSGG